MAIKRRSDKRAPAKGVVLPASNGAEGADGAPVRSPSALVVVRRPLGELLVEAGAISPTQLTGALGVQAEGGPDRPRLGELLVTSGAVSREAVVTALGQQYGLDVIDLRRVRPDAATVARLRREVAEELHALPVRVEAGVGVVVAVADPTIADLASRLEVELADAVLLRVADATTLHRELPDAYQAAEGLGDIIRAFEARVAPGDVGEGPVQVDETAPIVQVVTRILEKAVSDRASDVHIEPMADRIRVRNRIDGALKEVLSLPSSMSQALTSRIKIMASLNIVERRRPQDGQIEITVAGRQLDIRVSTAGTMFGESTVLRILDRQRALYGLADLGMPADVESRYAEVIQSPYGLVVCAGPTGSGKTTTLYTTLQVVKSDEINVMTVEDPVEYVFPDINQMSINETAGLTFASGLRAILRQDPDTILVGEIRDVETARIAIQAALTGHFVLSTVHATDAASAMHRFVDMGIESFLLASSLLATVGQRLVRRVCDHCSAPYAPTHEELAFYKRAQGEGGAEVFRAGTGCDACAGTGYFGRVGVYEVLRMTDELRDAVLAHAQTDVIRRVAIEGGMVPMQQRAIEMIDDGQTTIAEVMRTVYVV